MFSAAKPKLIAVAVVLPALWILPAPILPPHRLAEAAQSRAWDQLDGGLPRSRGFSFGDLAADRAGVRFAAAAKESEAVAKAMQSRLAGGFVADDFFLPSADPPENLTGEPFRRDPGSVGSRRYRQRIHEIEARMDRCAGLFLHPPG